MDSFICCSPRVARWEIDDWEVMFPLRSRNWMLGLRYLGSPGCLAAFVRRPSEKLELASVRLYPVPCVFYSLGSHPHFALMHVLQALGTWRAFFI